MLRGSVHSKSDGTPIAYASVYYHSQNIGTMTDSLGRFNIPLIKNDSLTIEHVSFEVITVFVSDTLLNITLNDKFIQLQEYQALSKHVNRSGNLVFKSKKAFKYQTSWALAFNGGIKVSFPIQSKFRIIKGIYLAVGDIKNAPVTLRISIIASRDKNHKNKSSDLLLAEHIAQLTDSNRYSLVDLSFDQAVHLPDSGFFSIIVEVLNPYLEYELSANGQYAYIKDKESDKNISILMETRKNIPAQYWTNASFMYRWNSIETLIKKVPLFDANAFQIKIKWEKE
ncbi:MAG: carboxypeptidase-like regulatory domain-containing protein [Bacteroidia bacterium]|jgi:hypothetical protein